MDVKMQAMTGRVEGLRVAVLTANDGVEGVELTEPRRALEAAGATVVLVAPEPGAIQLREHLDKGESIPVDTVVDAVSVGDFDGLVLPGGVANPDRLRMVPTAVELVRAFVQAGKPVAAICHGPWTLVEADVVRGRTLTSWPSLATDIRNADGTWVDDDVVVCDEGPGPLITSRKPDDLPRFCDETVSAFARAAATR